MNEEVKQYIDEAIDAAMARNSSSRSNSEVRAKYAGSTGIQEVRRNPVSAIVVTSSECHTRMIKVLARSSRIL